MKINRYLLVLVYVFLLITSCTSSDDTTIAEKEEEEEEELIEVCPDRAIDELKPDKHDWEFQFIDTFDDADVDSPDTGLEDNLEDRRLHGSWKSLKWIRKEGEEVEKTPSQWNTQVNHPTAPNALSFHLENSAVMLESPIISGSDDGYRISFTANPIKNDVQSDNWVSLMLDADSKNKGYVKSIQFGFSIASNGYIKVYQNGNLKNLTGTITPAAEYKIILDITPDKLIGFVNNEEINVKLDESLPELAYLFLGAEITKDSGKTSFIDELVVATRYSQKKSHIHYYGYYWASGFYGEHLAEVTDHTNFNFIEMIKPNTPNTKTHAVQVRWEMWSDGSGVINPNWESLWAAKLTQIKANIDKIRAIYLVDEPFWASNIKVEDYNMVMDKIREDLPGMPLITVFAYPIIEDTNDTRISEINCNIDWVGADKYVASDDFYQIENMNRLLMKAQPEKNIFLIPQTFFSGTTTDESVAEINWKFYNYALENEKVIGIFNFGLWTHQQPEEIPLTLKVLELIGNAIVNY